MECNCGRSVDSMILGFGAVRSCERPSTEEDYERQVMFKEEIVTDLGCASEETKGHWLDGDVLDGIWSDLVMWLRFWPH